MTNIVRKYLIVLAFIPMQLFLAFGYLRWGSAYEHANLLWQWGDDFFYYVKVAQGILDQGISTFDGTTLTNGYHPLWMWLMVLLGKIFGGFGDHFFLFLRILILLLNIFSGVLLYNLCSYLFMNRWLKYAAFVFHYGLICKFGFMGMEITLIMPLLLLLALAVLKPKPWGIGKWSALGLLGAAIILTRIDTFILVLPLYAFLIWQAETDQERKSAALGLIICLVPCLIYIGYNHAQFGTFLPVSGMAKQLKKSPVPTSNFLHSLFIPSRWADVFTRQIPLLIAFVSLCVALSALWYRRAARVKEDILSLQPVYLWFIIYPFAFYSILMIRYDWAMDDWYNYPLPQASVMGLGVLAAVLSSRRWYVSSASAIGIIGLALAIGQVSSSMVRMSRHTPLSQSAYLLSLDLRDFAKANPGLIGMGDRAGLASFICPSHILQLEGLMSDLRMYNHIKNEDDLIKVLNENKAVYYAVCLDLEKSEEGYVTREPQRPGNMACKMRGVFKEAPILRKVYANGSALSIFKVPQSPGRE